MFPEWGVTKRMITEVLRLERVTYREKDHIFLRDFDLDVRRGEIMGLLPLNAYGMPALLDVIQYNPPLYYGSVYYRGEMVNSWKDMKRVPNSITIVDNVSSLVAGQNVITNIFLLNNNSSFFIKEKKLEERLRPFMQEIGVDISPWMRAEELTAFERVVVEILRGVISGHRLIILREVSSYIGESKLSQLYGIMNYYRKKGISFLFISSHYEEIRNVCDRTALMSNGRILMKLDRKMTVELLEKIGAEENQEHTAFRKDAAADHERVNPILGIRGFQETCLDKLDLTIYEAEYIVIHAPDIKMFSELVRIIFGDSKQQTGYFFSGKEKIDPWATRDIAFLREKPDENMLFPKMSYMDNLLFTADHKVSSMWRSEGVKKSIRQEFSDFLGEDVFHKRVDQLSQKEKIVLVYTRILLQHPKVVFCEMPFKDVDMAIKLLIRHLHKRLIENGIAVVVLTMNLNETIPEADKVIRIS